jgi:hypothetical protein
MYFKSAFRFFMGVAGEISTDVGPFSLKNGSFDLYRRCYYGKAIGNRCGRRLGASSNYYGGHTSSTQRPIDKGRNTNSWTLITDQIRLIWRTTEGGHGQSIDGRRAFGSPGLWTAIFGIYWSSWILASRCWHLLVLVRLSCD